MSAPDRFATTAIAALSAAPTVCLHQAIFIGGGQIIGDDTLRLVSLQGQEAVCEPFEFQLELHGNTRAEFDQPITFADVIGRPMTLGIHTPALDVNGQPLAAIADIASDTLAAAFRAAIGIGASPTLIPDTLRPAHLSLINGIVAAFSIDQPGVYRITLRAAIWKLGLTNAYRVHAQCSIRQAIAALMQRHRIDCSVQALDGSDNPAFNRVQDWLQAGESDEEFLHRLMGKAHIYFYFVHSGTSHQVVFANRPAYPLALQDARPLRYCATLFDDDSLSQWDAITHYSYSQSLVPGSVQSVLTREEAAWEADAVAGLQNYSSASTAAQGSELANGLPFNLYQIVQYGGSQVEADHYAAASQQALEATRSELSGTSACAQLRSGHRFTLTQPPPRQNQQPTALRPELEGKAFVLTRVKHEATLDGRYQNDFQATDASALVAPFSIRETQQGSLLGQVASGVQPAPAIDWRYAPLGSCDPQSAALVDHSSSPQRLSARGVLVQFPTSGASAAAVWIKLAAHMQTVPEIGATVVVARAQDQSELPEIQSIIQSNCSQVIMPSGWTANTSIGSSYSTNYGDGKSIRFGLHSNPNLDAATDIVERHYASGDYREVSYSQGGSYSYSTAEQGAAGLLQRSDSLGSTYSTHTGAVSSSTSTFDNSDSISTVTGVASNISNHDTSINNSTSTLAQSTNIAGISQNNTLHGIADNNSLTGLAANISATGDSTELSAVVSSLRLHSGGTSNSISTQLASSEVSLSGLTSHVAIKGATSSIDITGAGFRADIAALRITFEVTAMTIVL